MTQVTLHCPRAVGPARHQVLRSVSIDWFQAFEVVIQRFLLFGRKQQKFKAIVVSAAVAEHRSQLPGKRPGGCEDQSRHLADTQFDRQEYSDPRFRQILAMSFQLLILIPQKQCEGNSKIAPVSRMPSAATVSLAGGFWSR